MSIQKSRFQATFFKKKGLNRSGAAYLNVVSSLNLIFYFNKNYCPRNGVPYSSYSRNFESLLSIPREWYTVSSVLNAGLSIGKNLSCVPPYFIYKKIVKKNRSLPFIRRKKVSHKWHLKQLCFAQYTTISITSELQG